MPGGRERTALLDGGQISQPALTKVRRHQPGARLATNPKIGAAPFPARRRATRRAARGKRRAGAAWAWRAEVPVARTRPASPCTSAAADALLSAGRQGTPRWVAMTRNVAVDSHRHPDDGPGMSG